MSPASTRRRETTAGKASPLSEKNGIGSSSPGPVRRAEPVGCVPERLHLFPRDEGCRGRHGEAAIVTPTVVGDAEVCEIREGYFWIAYCV